MDYTIYTIGGGEFLINILKGMTALTSSSAYIGILKTVAMFGLLWILLEVSFAGKFARSFKWFFGMFIAFNLLFVPKVTVIVEDKLNPQLKDNIIANVPFAVGVVGHFTSLAGDKMTELTETAYNSGMEYNKYGLLASVNVTDAVSRAKIVDPDFERTIRHLMKQCVFWDIALKKYTQRQLIEAPDMWEFLRTSTAKSRSFVIYDSKGKDEIIWCNEGIEKLNKMRKWDTEISELKKLIGTRLFPHLSKGEKDNAIDAGVNSFTGKLFQIAGGAEAALKQAMLINSYRMHAGTPFGSAWSYAQARTETQTKLTYDLIRKQAQSWLPVLRGVLQGILYGAFPLVMMLMLLPIGASVAKNYFAMFIWIESWGPIYAIINSMLGTYAGFQYSAEASSLGGFTAASHTAIMEINQNIASVAGNMMMFIPFIAGGLMWGARSFTSLATSMLATPMQTASEAAREVSTGNISLNNVQSGNMSYNTISGNKMNDSVAIDSGRMQAFNSMGGVTTIAPDGRMATDYTGSYSRNPGFDTKYMQSEISQAIEAANSSQTAGIGDAITAQESQMKGLDSYVQGVINQGKNTNWQDGYSHTLTADQRNAVQDYHSSVNDWAKSHGVSTEKAGKIFASVSASKVFKGFLGVNGGIEGSLSQSDRQLFEEAQKYMESTNFEHNKSIVDSLAKKKDYTFTDSQGNNTSYTIGENFKESESMDRSARANFEKAEGLRKEASYLQSEGYNITQDLQQPFMDYLRNTRDLQGDLLSPTRVHQIMTASEYSNKGDYGLRERLFEDFMRNGGKKMLDQYQDRKANIISDPSAFERGSTGMGGGDTNYRERKDGLEQTFDEGRGNAGNPDILVASGENIKNSTSKIEQAVTPPLKEDSNKSQNGNEGGTSIQNNQSKQASNNQGSSTKEVASQSSNSQEQGATQTPMPNTFKELALSKDMNENKWMQIFHNFKSGEDANKQGNDQVDSGSGNVPSAGSVGGTGGSDAGNTRNINQGGSAKDAGITSSQQKVSDNGYTNSSEDESGTSRDISTSGSGSNATTNEVGNKTGDDKKKEDSYKIKPMPKYEGSIGDKRKAIADQFNDRLSANIEEIEERIPQKKTPEPKLKGEVANAFGTGAVGIVNKITGGDKTFKQIEDEKKKREEAEKKAASLANDNPSGSSSDATNSKQGNLSSQSANKPDSTIDDSADKKHNQLEGKLDPEDANQNQNKKNKK